MSETEAREQKLTSHFADQVDLYALQSYVNKLLVKTSDKPSYLAISLSIPLVDVLAVIEQDSERAVFRYYWEKPVDDFAMAAGGELERLTTKGSKRFRTSSRNGKELLSRVHHFKSVNHSNAVVHLFGGFSFFDESNSENWKSFDSASFTLPEWMIIKEGKSCILTFITPLNPEESFDALVYRLEDQLADLEHICNAEDYTLSNKKAEKLDLKVPDKNSAEHLHWISSVEKARRQIQDQKFEKVVLARQLAIGLNEEISGTHILNRLRNQYPDCYSFLISHDSEQCFIGCTPERLATFNSRFVLTEGLAGSTSRGKTATEDAVLEHELLNNQKELKEHTIVRDVIEENLNEYSFEVTHPTEPSVKKLSNVQHLYTPITARIRDGVSRTEVLRTLHPTPAVGGYPREKAVAFIRETEDFDRGWYASPVGWINAHGNGEFVVAIRCGLIKKDEVRFFAGCGIVEDSDPEREWEETNLKFIPMLSALEYAGT